MCVNIAWLVMLLNAFMSATVSVFVWRSHPINIRTLLNLKLSTCLHFVLRSELKLFQKFIYQSTVPEKIFYRFGVSITELAVSLSDLGCISPPFSWKLGYYVIPYIASVLVLY